MFESTCEVSPHKMADKDKQKNIRDKPLKKVNKVATKAAVSASSSNSSSSETGVLSILRAMQDSLIKKKL